MFHRQTVPLNLIKKIVHLIGHRIFAARLDDHVFMEHLMAENMVTAGCPAKDEPEGPQQ